MGDVRDLPDQEGDAETPAGSDVVHDFAPGDVGHGVGELEIKHQVGIVGLRPAEPPGEVRFQQTDGLAIDVVDHHRGEE